MAMTLVEEVGDGVEDDSAKSTFWPVMSIEGDLVGQIPLVQCGYDLDSVSWVPQMRVLEHYLWMKHFCDVISPMFVDEAVIERVSPQLQPRLALLSLAPRPMNSCGLGQWGVAQ
jgi:hypothetical protein